MHVADKALSPPVSRVSNCVLLFHFDNTQEKIRNNYKVLKELQLYSSIKNVQYKYEVYNTDLKL